MKIMSTLCRVLLAACLFVASGVAAARSTEMLQLGRQELVTADAEPMAVAAVRKIIIAGGARHGWRPVHDKPGVLTLEASSGDHRAFVDVAYDARSFQITYKDSAEMGYEKSGDRVLIHPKYNRWIQDLGRSIRNMAIDAVVIEK